MFRESPSAKREQPIEKRPWPALVIWGCFLFCYFTFLPILVTILLNWALYSFSMNYLYSQAWIMPVVLLISTFLAGTLMRQKMEDESGGLGLFVLGIVAFILFAYLTYQDVRITGGVYSRFMPKLLRVQVLDFVWFLPGVGIVGMLFYKYFTLKHYN